MADNHSQKMKKRTKNEPKKQTTRFTDQTLTNAVMDDMSGISITQLCNKSSKNNQSNDNTDNLRKNNPNLESQQISAVPKIANENHNAADSESATEIIESEQQTKDYTIISDNKKENKKEIDNTTNNKIVARLYAWRYKWYKVYITKDQQKHNKSEIILSDYSHKLLVSQNKLLEITEENEDKIDKWTKRPFHITSNNTKVLFLLPKHYGNMNDNNGPKWIKGWIKDTTKNNHEETEQEFTVT